MQSLTCMHPRVRTTGLSAESLCMTSMGTVSQQHHAPTIVTIIQPRLLNSVDSSAQDDEDIITVCVRAGYDDLFFGGRDVGSILVYPQSRATSSLHETEWNNPFNVLSTDSNGFFYQQFIDADGDGDVVRQRAGASLVATSRSCRLIRSGLVGGCFINHLRTHYDLDV